jgi:hypothetical protein
MAVQIIPLKAEPVWEFTYVLEGLVWQFCQQWSYSAQAWRLDMSSIETGTTLKRLTLAPGVNLLKPLAVSELGKLYMVDVEGKLTNPDFDNVGDRYKLEYVPLAEVDDYPI